MVDSREDLYRSSESPVIEPGPLQFRGSSYILLCLPTPPPEFRQTGWPEVPAVTAASRSPPRSGGRRHRCAPHLASYLRRAGPGSREFSSAHHGEVGLGVVSPYFASSSDSRSGATSGGRLWPGKVLLSMHVLCGSTPWL